MRIYLVDIIYKMNVQELASIESVLNYYLRRQKKSTKYFCLSK